MKYYNTKTYMGYDYRQNSAGIWILSDFAGCARLHFSSEEALKNYVAGTIDSRKELVGTAR